MNNAWFELKLKELETRFEIQGKRIHSLEKKLEEHINTTNNWLRC